MFKNDMSLETKIINTFIVGFILSILSSVGIYFWARSEWMNFAGPFPFRWEGYTAGDFLALFAFTMAPIPFCMLFTVLQFYIRKKSTNESFTRYSITVIGSLIVFAGLGIFASFWSKDLLSCGVLFCLNPEVYAEVPNQYPEAANGFRATVGFYVLFPCLFLFIAILSNYIHHIRTFSYDTSDNVALLNSDSDPRPVIDAKEIRTTPYNTCLLPLNTDSSVSLTQSSQKTELTQGTLSRDLIIYSVSAVILLFLFYSTTYIPNNWEYFTPARVANFAAKLHSTNFTQCDTDWRNYSCPELPNATFRSMHWNPIWYFDIKFFPGNVFFYVYLITLPLFSLISRHVSFLNTFFSKRIRVDMSFTKLFFERPARNAFFSVREIAWIIYTAVTFYLFFHYWGIDHNYNGTYPGKNISFTESASRTTGQLAVFFLSLLFFPTARNSPILSLLGISWEAAIQYHRWLGVIFFVFTIAHMIFVYAWYITVGVFPQALFILPSKLPTGSDNFTVPLIQFIVWIMIVTIGAFAIYEPFRRKYFDIFMIAHHFTYLTLIPVVFWHAAAAWEYMMPGVLVWFVDRCVRVYRSSQAVLLVSPPLENSTDSGRYTIADMFNPDIARSVAGHKVPITSTGVGVSASSRGAAGDFVEIRIKNTHMKYLPGQYLFINVAEISLTEWHPFTIASPVHENAPGELLLIIKTMGKGTWTQSLFDYISLNSDEVNQKLTISVDGPTAHPINFTEYDNIILCGGGIGVTPVKSIYESLLLSYNHDYLPNSYDSYGSFNKRVHLIFSARDTSLFTIMSDSLQHVDGNGPFTAQLFCDNPEITHDSPNPNDASDPAASLIKQHIVYGRVDLEKEILEVVNQNESSADLREEIPKRRTLVFVCGPDGMSAACEEICHKYNLEYHTETFCL